MRCALLVLNHSAAVRGVRCRTPIVPAGRPEPARTRRSADVGHDRGMPQGVAVDHRRDPQIERHPLVVRTRELADTLLAPAAAEVDRSAVPSSHLDALAAAGILAMSGPPELGGVP